MKKIGREHWSGSLIFVLAAAGSAIGLGNLWKFPYITWKYGGGYFVLIYLICILGLGIPIMISEIAIGKISSKNPLGAIKLLDGAKSPFRLIGVMGVLGSLIILSYYSVVAGWGMQYVVYSLTDQFSQFSGSNGAKVSSELFKSLMQNPTLMTFWHTIFMGITTLVVIGGIKKGIEKTIKITMPLLLLIILLLVINSLTLDKEMKTFDFFFHGDLSKLSATAIIEAMGHAFFTLSIGIGIMITYGSYLPKDTNILKNSFWVVAMDTAIAILACLMIFPIILVYGMQPSGDGIGILFTTLPLELKKFPMGDYLTIGFYFLVVIAAITSAISMLEVVVTWLTDEKKIPRKKAVLISAFCIYILGLPSAFSVDSFLSLADNFATRVLLPAGGLGIALFVGYKMDMQLIKRDFEKHKAKPWHFKAFRFTIRYLTPALVLIVFVNTLFLFLKGLFES